MPHFSPIFGPKPAHFQGILGFLEDQNLRRPKLPPPPPQNAPPKKMSHMMVIKNASYTGEILATSSARLFPLVFDYPHIRFWHFAHNTNLRPGRVKYGKNSQILRRNPTECMCVSHGSISLHQRRHYSSTHTIFIKICSADSEILKFVCKQTDLTKTCCTGTDTRRLTW